MFDLTGKTALVTGASKGIGQSIALKLAEAGSDLVIWGKDVGGLEKTRHEAEKFGVTVAIESFDILDTAKISEATAKAMDQFGKIDTLAVNAGINQLRPFLEWTPDQWSHMIGVNLVGAIATIQNVGRTMVDRKNGCIITTSSIYSFVGAPNNSIYCLTKGGLMQLTKSLATEWARYNVRVNAICPGWIETDLTKPYMQDEKSISAGLKQIPMRRFGKPSDIGPMAVYLASDEAQWVTGQSFVIDGGQIAK